MAKCDEGYLCDVCGHAVEGIATSDLYLRFVIGEIDPERLHVSPERHIACNPILAQFIDDEAFRTSPVGQAHAGEIPAGFGLDVLDEDFVASRRSLVTRGWRRLHEIAKSSEPLAIHEYPLDDVRSRWQ